MAFRTASIRAVCERGEADTVSVAVEPRARLKTAKDGQWHLRTNSTIEYYRVSPSQIPALQCGASRNLTRSTRGMQRGGGFGTKNEKEMYSKQLCTPQGPLPKGIPLPPSASSAYPALQTKTRFVSLATRSLRTNCCYCFRWLTKFVSAIGHGRQYSRSVCHRLLAATLQSG